MKSFRRIRRTLTILAKGSSIRTGGGVFGPSPTVSESLRHPLFLVSSRESPMTLLCRWRMRILSTPFSRHGSNVITKKLRSAQKLQLQKKISIPSSHLRHCNSLLRGAIRKCLPILTRIQSSLASTTTLKIMIFDIPSFRSSLGCEQPTESRFQSKLYDWRHLVFTHDPSNRGKSTNTIPHIAIK